MSIVAIPPNEFGSDDSSGSIADLLHRLGDIAPVRALTWPAPGHATSQDLVHLNECKVSLFELVDGTIVEKTLGTRQTLIAAYLIRILGNYVDPLNLGFVTGPDGMIQLRPSLIRIPDVAFISWNRIEGDHLPLESTLSIAPDLAVEVLSPSNTKREMERKREEYFANQCLLVWCIDPATRTVEVYDTPDHCVILGEGDTLRGGIVLPDFSVEVRQIFSVLERRRRTPGEP